MSRTLKNRGLKSFLRGIILQGSLQLPTTAALALPAARDKFPQAREVDVGASLAGLCSDGFLQRERQGLYNRISEAQPATPAVLEADMIGEALEALVTVEKVLRRYVKIRAQLEALGVTLRE